VKGNVVASYTFDQLCRPRGDFRIPEMIEFFDLILEAFRLPALYDSRDRPLSMTETELNRILEKAAARQLPGLGADVDFFTIPPSRRDPNTARIEIHTGTSPDKKVIDFYSISMDDGRKVPDFEFFEKSIPIFKPFEAFLAEGDNEYELNSYDRQRANPGFTRPAIIRGFHYLDKDMARSIGGIKNCLKAPAWHVEKFCDGVLIELVPGLFDSQNPEHLRIQRDVMDYFDM
jgi:hypothetical protein